MLAQHYSHFTSLYYCGHILLCSLVMISSVITEFSSVTLTTIISKTSDIIQNINDSGHWVITCQGSQDVRRTINELEVSAEVKCCHTSAIFIITHIFYWCWAAAGEKTKCFYNFSFLCLAGVMCRYSVVGRDVVSRCDRGQVGLTWPMFQYSRSNSSNMTTFLLLSPISVSSIPW